MHPVVHGAILGAVLTAAVVGTNIYFDTSKLTEAELETARTLSLGSLPPLPDDPSNKYADDPAARALGELLFFDVDISLNQDVACATCHLDNRQFQDDLPLGKGVGTTGRRTMPLRGVGYASWLFWDGRKDSVWSQALGPVESAVEHGFTRTQVAQYIAQTYAAEYEPIFGPLPDVSNIPPASPAGNETQQAAWAALPAQTQDDINRVFANFGKSIAAYERTLMPVENRFDRFTAAMLAGETPTGDAVFTEQEIQGFKIFAGKGECTKCHNGPRLTDEFFHNTGVASTAHPVTDHGRLDALDQVTSDIFNCTGDYSDAGKSDCGELRFMSRDEHLFDRAFKAPSLRGVADRPPYMHAGQIATLPLVIEHYNRAPKAVSGHSEIEPLRLTTEDKAALLAFLKTL